MGNIHSHEWVMFLSVTLQRPQHEGKEEMTGNPERKEAHEARGETGVNEGQRLRTSPSVSRRVEEKAVCTAVI